MAKQTFTTGQVLTAAQMTSLQQTAMGGGSATAKTASYVLVAADAGTTVIMNAAGSTTITVNTSLFSAGDTVLIQNIGAGTCTVTAGTATVSTAGSLALTQYEAGILYFTSASAALFHDYVQAASNPLTTTGDMIYSSSGSTQARLGIGSSAQVLTVASGIPSWATPASGALTLISSTTIGTGVSSVTVSSAFSATYDNYRIVATFDAASAATSTNLELGSGGNVYIGNAVYMQANSATVNGATYNPSTTMFVGYIATDGGGSIIQLINPNRAKKTLVTAVGGGFFVSGNPNNLIGGTYFANETTQYTAFKLSPATGTLTGGTIRVYGYQNS